MSQLFMRRPDLGNLPPLPALPPGYTLRLYREGDLEPLTALMRRAFDKPEWTPEKINAMLIADPTVKQTFVIDFEGVPVASASARVMPEYPGSGYVHWVGVDPAHRGQKLGYVTTLAALHAFAEMDGLKDAVLETDDDRLPAIKTYQNLGFAPENRHDSHPERWGEIFANLAAAINL